LEKITKFNLPDQDILSVTEPISEERFLDIAQNPYQPRQQALESIEWNSLLEERNNLAKAFVDLSLKYETLNSSLQMEPIPSQPIKFFFLIFNFIYFIDFFFFFFFIVYILKVTKR